jgi:hypothetical protein
MKQIEIQCELYRGFAEPEGTAAVCVNCDGTGCAVVRYKPWTGQRKGR